MTERGDGSRQRAAATKRANTSRRIIQAAREVMNSVPWQDVQMKEIAARAGLGQATIYKYHPNKRSLIGVAYAEYFTELRQSLDDDLKQFSATQALKNLVLNLAVRVRSLPTMTINIMTATREQTLLGSLLEENEIDILSLVPFSSLMIDCLTQARDRGEIEPDIPVQKVGSYHTNGLLLRLFFDPDESPEDTAKLVLSQILPVLGSSWA